eukprot:4873571-Lingulodinium_polyedra.AAC.1
MASASDQHAPAPQDADEASMDELHGATPPRTIFQGQLWEWAGTSWTWIRVADEGAGASASAAASSTEDKTEP